MRQGCVWAKPLQIAAASAASAAAGGRAGRRPSASLQVGNATHLRMSLDSPVSVIPKPAAHTVSPSMSGVLPLVSSTVAATEGVASASMAMS